MLRTAQVSPFEARGQVFVVASAESLTGEAANALLKTLEEPHVSSPRNFLLLAPSRLDLLPTLRSRSLAVFLGPAERGRPGGGRAAGAGLLRRRGRLRGQRLAAIYLLSAAGRSPASRRLGGPALRPPLGDRRLGRFLRSLAPPMSEDAGRARAARLALAEALLEAPACACAASTAERILEGLVARHLACLSTLSFGRVSPGDRRAKIHVRFSGMSPLRDLFRDLRLPRTVHSNKGV